MGSSASHAHENLTIPIGGTSSSSNKVRRDQNRVKTTKYTLLTFLPLNFYDQFRRAVYFYFLVVTIISFFVNSTISPMVSLLPLLFVMIVTAIKEGREDYLRYKNDKLVNSGKACVLRQGQRRTIQSKDIAVGDLVIVKRDAEVPCDLVLLHSTDPYGKCFITTANLDGETNLKTLFVPHNLPSEELETLGLIECEPPQTDLYSFKGKILLTNAIQEILPLTTENLLLRGARVKNTECVIGCAVYIGMNTKLQLNSRFTGNKSASSEVYINRFLIFLVVGMVIAVTALYFIGRHKEIHTVPNMGYLGPPIKVNSFTQIMEDYLSFLILFNYMVPISMYMNIELYRVFGAYFIESDRELYDAETDQPALVNASNLNEDLGQIQILFSDKTGTLTKNEMVFQQCSIGGIKFLYQNGCLVEENTSDYKKISQLQKEHLTFFEALAVCHTVQVTDLLGDIANDKKETSQLSYQASSADELALIEACRDLGLIYLGDEGDVLTLECSRDGRNDSYKFNRLEVLEFSSERKRMSVIIEDEFGEKWLYTKGAESSIFPLCDGNSADMVKRTDTHISDFAKTGLRTLAVARKLLQEKDYQEFKEKFKIANSSFENRQELIEDAYALLEKDLELLGATAVEDALQDEVDSTLVALQEAGIRIWVLTGDKVETAYNIGLACKHIPKNSIKYFIVNCCNKESLKEHFMDLEHQIASEEAEHYSLIIDGISLSVALEEVSGYFRDLAMKCKAVLCCRLSPLQKSEVVTLIKASKEKLITAAVGDGANDVSMIQEAHVGVGIMGKEGHQAARCADYAIGKFSMLQRLLLVHGHYNTSRLSFLVLFYCYKNIIHTACMFLFQFYNLYSSTAVFHGLFMWLFDIVYLSYSFTFVAMTEKPYPEQILLSQPCLYKKIARNRQVSWPVFLTWMLNGAFHGAIIFYFAYIIFSNNNAILIGGQTADFYGFGAILIQMVISVGNLKLLLLCNYISWILLLLIVLSFMGFVFTTVIYNIIIIDGINTLYNVYSFLYISPTLWLYALLTSAACLTPDLFIKAIQVSRKRITISENVASFNKGK